MNNKKFILVSIFRRKGGEGCILYYKSSLNWCLITNENLIFKSNEKTGSIPFADVVSVIPDLRKQFEIGVTDKHQFSILKITLEDNSSVILYLESGKPFWGILQILSWAK